MMTLHASGEKIESTVLRFHRGGLAPNEKCANGHLIGGTNRGLSRLVAFFSEKYPRSTPDLNGRLC